MRNCIINGTVVTPEMLLPHHAVIMQDDRILSVLPMEQFNSSEINREEMYCFDAMDGYVMPGFIDLHSDYIEGIIQPRPTSLMEFETSLREAEKQLLGSGVTTIYHSLSLMQSGGMSGRHSLRSRENLEKLLKLITDFHEGHHLIHHRVHIRYEISNLDIYDYLIQLLKSTTVNLLSLMDHTPGQGQYRDLELYAKSYPNWQQVHGGKTFEEVISERQSRPVASHDMLKRLAALAHELKIPLASHDDDTLEKLSLMKNEYNIKISEFPIELEVAKQARSDGILVVVGAPNIMLGGSHSGNLSAVDAIKADAADILCSDYYPSSLMHSAFKLEADGIISLPAAIRMLTLNPAKAMGIDDNYGAVEAGKKADLLVVRKINGKPMVSKCFIDGYSVLQLEYRLGEGAYRAAS